MFSKDVKSSMEVRSSLRQFMRSESLFVLREISEKNVEEKLLVLEFLVRTFALVGDVEVRLLRSSQFRLLHRLSNLSMQSKFEFPGLDFSNLMFLMLILWV